MPGLTWNKRLHSTETKLTFSATNQRLVMSCKKNSMRLTFFIGCLLLFTACDKKPPSDADADVVEIYLLKEFKTDVDTSSRPAIIVMSDATISTIPFVTNENILYYNRSSHTFKLRQDIKPYIKDYGPDKGFAVTVNKIPVYFGTFHPSYLSSIRMGIATIDPFLTTESQLRIDYFNDGSPRLQQLDKRNDSRLINALLQTGRIR